jgi:hypothetical protein
VWIPHEGRFALVEETKKKIMILIEMEQTYIKLFQDWRRKGGCCNPLMGLAQSKNGLEYM